MRFIYQLLTRLLFVLITETRVLIYNTENDQSSEKFDCVYYKDDNDYDDEVAYCQRLSDAPLPNRDEMECKNLAIKIFFQDLIDQDIEPTDALEYSSNVELADLYARVFYNRSLLAENAKQFICNCTLSGTFGRYCEYQLTHDKTYFSETITAQFDQKARGDSWNTQRYGKILCYETLPCNTSDLCLDWRDICDGVQQCSSGIDEENWDKLEFNECEDDEYRCNNGMCIAEEFWLDGWYFDL